MNKLQNFILTMPMGFMASKDVAELVKIDRLFPVLVRCGGCRFTCAAQDVEHLCKCILAGNDYIRDVSFPHGSVERAATWVEFCPVTPLSALPFSFTAPSLSKLGTFRASPATHFDESQCGGVYDGVGTVTSDADPGL